MRKKVNIVFILSIIVAILELTIGMFDKLGIPENIQPWITYGGLIGNLLIGAFTNLKSGQEIKELKSHYLK